METAHQNMDSGEATLQQKQQLRARAGQILDECDGDGPSKCGFWGSTIAAKQAIDSNCVRARGKFWMNAMETAHQNVESGRAKRRRRGVEARTTGACPHRPHAKMAEEIPRVASDGGVFPRTPCGGGGAAGPQKGNPIAQGPKSAGGGAARGWRTGYAHNAAVTQPMLLDFT